ncbi:hypothetical protein H9P43_001050 [Blastocladiella emersonii ATCC 22665]|nr:hypothetical protein H9P43_001050 [Blastocladiella emersonii ATCC 22665]
MEGNPPPTSPSSASMPVVPLPQPPVPPQPGAQDGASSGSGNTGINESTLRRQILAIQQDKSLPDSEKARRIQQLMSGSFGQKHCKPGGGPKAIPVFNEPGQIRAEERAPMYHDEENAVYGCKHYMRSVKLQSHCCGKWVVCRFCHDEVSDHAIIRQKTKLMMCMRCYHIQPCSQFCSNEVCGVKVSRYYCNECKLWDDDPKKNIYHCYDCGICRIGKGLGHDYFHCKKCNVCMAIGLKDRHKCIERNLESDCPICGEYMFTSTTTVIFMPCGHCIHHKCYQEHIQTSYTCPTCCKSLGNMSEYFSRIEQALKQHQMPPEYANHASLVFCNDCEARSVAPYHFMYHKCGGSIEVAEQVVNQTTGQPETRKVAHPCGSYNTKVLQTYVRGTADEASVMLQLEAANAAGAATPVLSSSPAPSATTFNNNGGGAAPVNGNTGS